jgi:phage shock protein C
MFCTSCGFQLHESDRFCAQCGRGTPRAEGAPPAPPRVRRLTRPVYDKSIAGVCAGFARYLEVDVILVRVLWLTLAIVTGGLGFIAYLVAWIVMPKEYAPPPMAPASAQAESAT